jgi:hypothetical protein
MDYFLIILLFIGIALFYLAWTLDAQLEKLTCANPAIKTSLKLLLSTGAVLVTASTTLLANSISTELSQTVFNVTMIILGIFIIVLGSIIVANSSDDGKSPGSNCKIQGADWVWIIGVLMVLVSGGVEGTKIYKATQK